MRSRALLSRPAVVALAVLPLAASGAPAVAAAPPAAPAVAVERAATSAVTFTSPAPGDVLPAGQVVFRGTAAPHQRIVLVLTDGHEGWLEVPSPADADGRWTHTTRLGPGSYYAGIQLEPGAGVSFTVR